MIITRKANNRVDAKPWEVIISHIDHVLSDVYGFFFTAFSGGLKDPENDGADRRALFCDIWECLSKIDIATFANIDELNNYYSAYIKNLGYYISDYCNNHKIPVETVTENTIDLLVLVAKIYYSLVKQKYILQLFRAGDEVRAMPLLLAALNQECSEVEKISSVINVDEIKNALTSISIIFNEVINGLKSKGFGEIESDFVLDDLPKKHQIDLSKIRDVLKRIPSSDELNHTIDRLEEAQKSGHSQVEKSCRAELKKIVLVIEEVMQQLGVVVSDDLRQQAQHLYQLLQRSDLLDKKLLLLNEHFQKVEVFPLAVQLYGCKNNSLDAKSGYAELMGLAKSVETLCGIQLSTGKTTRVSEIKAWGIVGDKVSSVLPALVKEMNNFIQPYMQYMKTFQNLNLRIDQLNEKKNILDTLRMSWAARLKKAEHVWQKCYAAAVKAKNTLLAHAESNTEYIHAFLSRHKFAMLFGSVGGTGTGVTLSALLFAFEALTTGVMVGSGAVFGVGIAAVIGFGIDYYRHAKANENDKPLTRIDKAKINPDMFAGLSFPKSADDLVVAAPMTPSLEQQWQADDNVESKPQAMDNSGESVHDHSILAHLPRVDSLLPDLPPLTVMPKLPNMPNWMKFQAGSSESRHSSMQQGDEDQANKQGKMAAILSYIPLVGKLPNMSLPRIFPESEPPKFGK